MALTRQSLTRYLVEKQGVDAHALAEEPLLFTSGLLDSFTMVDLILFIEEEGGFKMRAAEVNLDNLDSITRILAYADARQ